jgi:phage protein U
MFAVLGEIVFELLSSPEAFDSTRTWDYAEHRVVEDRPKLQWLAAGLETIEFDFHFHISFTEPAVQAAALIAAADDHNARALVFGNGIHRGYFIVTSIRTTAQQMGPAGDLIGITMRTGLKEWAFASEIDASASPVASFPLIGVVAAPPGVVTGSIAYSGPGAIGPTFATSGQAFVPPPLSAPGVSPILNLPAVAGLTAPRVGAGDVPPSVIVRAPTSPSS